MPRGMINKNDIQSFVYKLKTELYDGVHTDKTGQWHDGAHYALSKILDRLQEYRE